jgi:hypothetical protein
VRAAHPTKPGSRADACQRYALLLTAGKFGWIAIENIADLQHCSDTVHDVMAGHVCHTRCSRARADGKQSVLLKQKANGRSLVEGSSVRILKMTLPAVNVPGRKYIAGPGCPEPDGPNRIVIEALSGM